MSLWHRAPSITGSFLRSVPSPQPAFYPSLRFWWHTIGQRGWDERNGVTWEQKITITLFVYCLFSRQTWLWLCFRLKNSRRLLCWLQFLSFVICGLQFRVHSNTNSCCYSATWPSELLLQYVNYLMQQSDFVVFSFCKEFSHMEIF